MWGGPCAAAHKPLMATAEELSAVLLPLWRVPEPTVLARGLTAGVPVWRAEESLRRGVTPGEPTPTERVRAMQAALDQAEQQLAQVMAELQAVPAARSLEPAPLSDAQAELFETLNATRVRDLAGTRGAFDNLEPHLREFREWLQTVAGLFAPQVVVETPAGEAAAARTSVTWLGDFASAYPAASPPDVMRRHCGDVELALANRAQALRSIALVVGGATRIAVLLATPGTSWIMILGAVWRFVRRFLLP